MRNTISLSLLTPIALGLKPFPWLGVQLHNGLLRTRNISTARLVEPQLRWYWVFLELTHAMMTGFFWRFLYLGALCHGGLLFGFEIFPMYSSTLCSTLNTSVKSFSHLSRVLCLCLTNHTTDCVIRVHASKSLRNWSISF